MRNPNAVEPTISAVPVSLYRELCSELQEKNGEVNALQLKNQRLTDENQQLRQEFQRLVQMVMHSHHQMSQVAIAEQESTQSSVQSSIARDQTNWDQANNAALNLELQERLMGNAAAPKRQALKPTQNLQLNPRILTNAATDSTTAFAQPAASKTPAREEWITGTHHQPIAQRLLQQGSTMAQELRGWRLALVISLIILSAFGAGFLIVRPLLNSQTAK